MMTSQDRRRSPPRHEPPVEPWAPPPATGPLAGSLGDVLSDHPVDAWLKSELDATPVPGASSPAETLAGDAAELHAATTSLLTLFVSALLLLRSTGALVSEGVEELEIVLQAGAVLTGWLALQACIDRRHTADATGRPLAPRVPALEVVAGVSILVHLSLLVADSLGA